MISPYPFFPQFIKKQLLYFTAFLALLLLGSPVSGWAQTRFFVEAPDFKEATRAEKNVSAYRVYRLDVAALRSYLANAPVEFTADSRPALRLSVPLPNGTTETFAIYDSPVLAPVVAPSTPISKPTPAKRKRPARRPLSVSASPMTSSMPLCWACRARARSISKNWFRHLPPMSI